MEKIILLLVRIIVIGLTTIVVAAAGGCVAFVLGLILFVIAAMVNSV